MRSAVGRSSRSSGGGADSGAARRRGACGVPPQRGDDGHPDAGSSTRGEGTGGPLETRLVEKGFSLMMVTGGQESGPAGGKTGA